MRNRHITKEMQASCGAYCPPTEWLLCFHSAKYHVGDIWMSKHCSQRHTMKTHTIEHHTRDQAYCACILMSR